MPLHLGCTYDIAMHSAWSSTEGGPSWGWCNVLSYQGTHTLVILQVPWEVQWKPGAGLSQDSHCSLHKLHTLQILGMAWWFTYGHAHILKNISGSIDLQWLHCSDTSGTGKCYKLQQGAALSFAVLKRLSEGAEQLLYWTMQSITHQLHYDNGALSDHSIHLFGPSQTTDS